MRQAPAKTKHYGVSGELRLGGVGGVRIDEDALVELLTADGSVAAARLRAAAAGPTVRERAADQLGLNDGGVWILT